MNVVSSSDMESPKTLETFIVTPTTKVIPRGETSTISTGKCSMDPEASETQIPAFSPEASETPIPAYSPEESEAGIPVLQGQFQAPPAITHVMEPVVERKEFRPSRMAECTETLYLFCYGKIFWVVYYAIVTSSMITSLVLALLLDAPASWPAYGILAVSIVGFFAPVIVTWLGWISTYLLLSTSPLTSPSTSEKEPHVSQKRMNAGNPAFDSPVPQVLGVVQESSTGDTTDSSSSPRIVVLSADIHAEQVKEVSRPATGEGTSEVVPFGTSGGSTVQS
ncbi:uncharacterized protein LOC118179520 isoform X2 [Stegodyphus dumicola]|uniref:uncharacterized protein LOC118179520 isoform X2 n=1 Tax=Stegodyphus dumicola TaxID=202533 RepID=UPI0015AA8EB1|nr:uncharacterized protein LOC118179520 isoform X2 [Stegodyphus dumicola]